MKVIQFSRYGTPGVLELADARTPEASSGMVRIRVRAAAVNPADTKWRAGMFQEMSSISLPHVLGYDVAGEIDQVGDAVTGRSVGDRVFAKLDPITKGGYAEFALIPAADAVALPKELDFAIAAAIPTAGLTGVQMVEHYAQPEPGALVLVTGAVGAVGRFAVHAALRRGASVVAAVRVTQTDEARSLGAKHVIVLDRDDWKGPSFDHVLDTVGGASVGRLCRHLAANGRIFTASTTPIPAEALGSEPMFVMVQSDPAKLAELAQAAAAKEIIVPIAKRLPLAEAAEAHRLVEVGGTGGKIILEP